MKTTQYPRSLFAFAGCCLIFLLAACGSSITPPLTGNGSGTVTPGKASTMTSGTTSVVTTVPMPQTQTACPPAGTARAAVTAPLALGNHQNIVYYVNQTGNPSDSILKRYDVTTGNRIDIIKLAGTYIPEVQVSADGQWLLFVATVNLQQKLQMVRMDGQGLQTLMCGPVGRIQNVLWSTNQKLVLFNGLSNDQGGIYLLNLETGALQLELQPADSGPPLNMKYTGTPVTWLDNTRAYVSFTDAPIAPLDRLGLLDTSRGPNQPASNLTTVFQNNYRSGTTFNYPCWNIDSSYDGSTLFAAQCSGISAPNCSGSCVLGTREGPSIIITEPAKGGPQHTILSSQTLGIATVRAISSSTLLLQVKNFSQNHTVDSSQNGLWKANTDGTGLTRLTTEAPGITTSLCPFSQNPWSNVSRDGHMYAFATNSSGSYPSTYTLSFGLLNGGSPISFASIADGTQLSIVGWTTMS